MARRRSERKDRQTTGARIGRPGAASPPPDGPRRSPGPCNPLAAARRTCCVRHSRQVRSVSGRGGPLQGRVQDRPRCSSGSLPPAAQSRRRARPPRGAAIRLSSSRTSRSWSESSDLPTQNDEEAGLTSVPDAVELLGCARAATQPVAVGECLRESVGKLFSQSMAVRSGTPDPGSCSEKRSKGSFGPFSSTTSL